MKTAVKQVAFEAMRYPTNLAKCWVTLQEAAPRLRSSNGHFAQVGKPFLCKCPPQPTHFYCQQNPRLIQ